MIHNGRQAFEAAIINQDLETISRIFDAEPELLNQPMEVDIRTDWTPLHFAVDSRSTSTIELLLNRGANPNVRDSEGMTPLHLAAANIDPQSARLLVNHGADVNSFDANGGTPISYCNPSESSRPGEPRTHDILMAHGAKVDFVGALTFGYFDKCRELLAQEGPEFEDYVRMGPYLCEMFLLTVLAEAYHALDQQGKNRLTDDKSQAVDELVAANRDILHALFNKGAPRTISDWMVNSLCDRAMLPVLRELVANSVKFVHIREPSMNRARWCARDHSEIGQLLRQLGVDPLPVGEESDLDCSDVVPRPEVTNIVCFEFGKAIPKAPDPNKATE